MDLARNHVNCQLPEMIETSSLLVHSAPKNSWKLQLSRQGFSSSSSYQDMGIHIWHMTYEPPIFFCNTHGTTDIIKKNSKEIQRTMIGLSHISDSSMSRKQNCYDCLIDLLGIACAFLCSCNVHGLYPTVPLRQPLTHRYHRCFPAIATRYGVEDPEW